MATKPNGKSKTQDEQEADSLFAGDVVSVTIGYTTGLRADAQSYLQQPPPDGRCKNAESKAASVYEKTERFLASSQRSKWLGRLDTIVATAMPSMARFSSDPQDRLCPAAQFVNWLRVVCPTLQPYLLPLYDNFGYPYLYALDPKTFVRLLGTDCMISGQRAPLRLWYDNRRVFDPYAMLTEDGQRDFVGIEKVWRSLPEVKRAGINIEAYRPGTDAKSDMRVVTRLCQAMGLTGSLSEAELYPG